MKIKDLETRGVEIEKLLRGEDQNIEQLNETSLSKIGSSDEELLKDLLDIWRNITQLKRRDEELIIRQQELQLEHRHAQLKEELSIRLSCSSEFKKDLTLGKMLNKTFFNFPELDKSAQDIAAEGAILTEMLELVAKRAALRPSENQTGQSSLQSENVSLPVLPPQTTINPLLQHQLNMKPSTSSSYNYQRNPNRNSSSSSQASNQKELDVSSDLFEGTDSFYLRTNLSILHDCEVLLERYENSLKFSTISCTKSSKRDLTLLIFQFIFLYIAVISYSFYCTEKA